MGLAAHKKTNYREIDAAAVQKVVAEDDGFALGPRDVRSGLLDGNQISGLDKHRCGLKKLLGKRSQGKKDKKCLQSMDHRRSNGLLLFYYQVSNCLFVFDGLLLADRWGSEATATPIQQT